MPDQTSDFSAQVDDILTELKKAKQSAQDPSLRAPYRELLGTVLEIERKAKEAIQQEVERFRAAKREREIGRIKDDLVASL